ncbi:MAG: NADH-quinone oxidoreductase subunit G [Actinomycetota bacterium]
MAAERKQVTLTIDGREITVDDGTLIIRAAEQIDTYIPRFCDHPYLAPLGACRQCLVEVEGQRKPLTACTTPVAEGMIVKTQFTSEMASDAQEGVLELLLINHPLDCPMCDKGGECPLQDQALAYGPGGSRYIDPKRRFVKPVPISPLVYLDRERCVLCARCTRFANEISGDPFIELFERGALEQVAIFEDEPYESVFSGNVIQICPVGALTSAQFRFKARPFDMASTPSVCNHCSAGCNMTVQTRRDQIVRVLAADNAEVNEVWSCDKGRFGQAYVQRPERLVEPLVRKEGEFVGVSWAEAFRAVVERIDVVKRAGTRTAVLAGGRLADEDAFALSRFARTVLGTNDVDQRMRAGSAEEDDILAQVAGTAGTSYGDLEAAKAIVVVGSDLQQESPIVFLRVHKAATRREAVVFEIGARATTLARRTRARSVLCPPGTEAGVLLGVASELAARGLAAVDEGLRAAATGPNATTLLDQSRASAGDIGSLADALAAAGPDAVVVCGDRLAQSPGALAAAWNISLSLGTRFVWLPRRAGARGGLDAGLHPRLLPGGRRVDDATARAEVEQVWGAGIPASPGRDTRDILEASADIGLLFLAGVDHATDFGDATLGRRALDRAPFVVADDLFLTDSSRRAHVVFPVSAIPEREGTLTDWEGRSQPFAAAVTPAGVSRPDWDILSLLANEAGVAFPRTLVGLRREMTALGRDPRERTAVELPPPHLRRLDEHQPFTLLTYPLLLDAGTMLLGASDLLETSEGAFVEIGQADAERLGVKAGDRLRVESACGAVEAPARIGGLADRCVFVPANNLGARGLSMLDAGEPVTLVTVEKV